MDITSAIALANGVVAVYNLSKMAWRSESAHPNDLIVAGTLATLNTVCMFGLLGMHRPGPK